MKESLFQVELKIGFVGLGIMGGPMALHLARVYPAWVYDVDAGRMNRIEGAVPCDSVAALAPEVDVVLTSLPTSQIVEQVVLGERGLRSNLRTGSVVIDTSTTDPALSRKMAQALSLEGISFLDAPVSGGEKAAREGNLAIMVGGAMETFEWCRPVLEVMGKSIVRVGEVGAGGVAKLVNNMIVAATFSIVAEGFALGLKNSVDPAVLYSAIKDGWAGSRVLEVAAPGIIERNFAPGGTVDLLVKDLGYACNLATETGVPVPVTETAKRLFELAQATGRGHLAQPVLIELWEHGIL